ncbi:MAG: TonB family protein [Candidatus Omnitrophota bacterium]|nr:TonB family protein [Candidatus Omnitrophota bacterium]
MAKKISLISVFILLFNFTFLWNGSALKNDEGENVTLVVGENRVFPVRSPTRVVVANPEVADVVDVTNSEVTVSAKASGKTTLVLWDAYGEQPINLKVIQEDMAEIKKRVDRILANLNFPRVYSQVEQDENRVALLGTVKTAADKERIGLALGALKSKTVDLVLIKEEEAVVEIDVQILELNKGATDTLGITWPGALNVLEKGSAGISAAGAHSWDTLFKILNFQRGTTDGVDPFTFKLDLLIQEGKARILSRPRLACQSGKEADLLVGGEKPIFTTAVQSTVGASTSVDYKEYGIKLKIKPTVNEEERIRLSLDVEVSDVGEAETIGGTNATAKAYPLTKRAASTELFLSNGQTMVIGGLIKQKTEEQLRKVPWLADVPVLGMFFRKRTTTSGKGHSSLDDTELFITLTPTIVSRDTPPPQAKESGAGNVLPRAEAPMGTTAVPANLVNYIRAVQNKIIAAVYYPRQARDAGWEGLTKLSLNIDSNGELKSIKVAQSSGYKMLDDAALDTAAAQAPYPPFPPQIDSQELAVDVPIAYKKN